MLPVYVFAQDETTEEQVLMDVIQGSFSSERMDGLYLPDVTPEMSNSSYWSQKLDNPDEVLADWAAISAINEAVLKDPNTNMNDLRNWPETVYDGIGFNNALRVAAEENALYAYNQGARFDKEGHKYTTWESAKENIYDAMINNAPDPEATNEMPILYGICTKRTCLLILPTDHPLWDDYTDPDFGYLWQSVVRVNEPLILKTRSADGLYYYAVASSGSGWVAAEDVAICSDKEEWLDAWDLSPEKTLVVYGDKVYTEESYYAPETSNRLLTMGTCLELADESEWKGLIINRRAYNNHIVYLPVRNEDGSYRKVLALIGENRKVNEGFLPLTQKNVLSVMLNDLGDTYGWGGMLLSNDCSGYVQDVYKCFGLEMARNTSSQPAEPVYKNTWDVNPAEIAALTPEEREKLDQEKMEIIRNLPAGTALYIKGHTMMYLGEDNGKLYVISSVSDVVLPEDIYSIRVRGALINTTDIRRGRSYQYINWLEAIHTAVVPYYTPDHVITLPLKDDDVSLEAEAFPYTGKEITPEVTVTYKGRVLTQDTDYSVEYADNTEVGQASVTVTGLGKYAGSVTKNFSITIEPTTIELADKTAVYTGRQINIDPAVITGSTAKPVYTYYSDKECKTKVKEHTNAGTYYVKASVASDGVHEAKVSKPAKLTIRKATSAVILMNKTTAYTGKQVKIDPASTEGSSGSVVYKYYSNKACTKEISAPKNVGTYYVKAVLKADKNYDSAISSIAVLKITKAANTLKVTVKSSQLKAYASKDTTINAKNIFRVTGNKGTVTFKKTSGNEKITVASNGNVTVKKGLKKGAVYTVKVKVTAAGNENYLAGSKTVSLKIKVQ